MAKVSHEMNYTLVTQSFGKENEYRRAILTVWSFYAQTKDSDRIRTILLTDNPPFFQSYFKGLPVEYILLTGDKIKSMRGAIDFLHRMKITLIEEAFDTCSTNILYADSDTFFTSDPSQLMANLSPGISYMHLREYRFDHLKDMPLPAGEAFRKFHTLISTQRFDLGKGYISLNDQMHSWNAGVMMLHRSHRQLIPDVYALTDQLYPATQNHASEQYAFSIILQNNTTIFPCESVIHHYWYRVKKSVMDNFLILQLTNAWTERSPEQKKNDVLAWTEMLPLYLEEHVWMVRDKSVQAFNENNFRQGFFYAAKAFVKNPFNIKFLRDVLYHSKRYFTL